METCDGCGNPGEMCLCAAFEARDKRTAELEAALRDCIEIAASDCEHEACKLVIERASKLVQLEDL